MPIESIEDADLALVRGGAGFDFSSLLSNAAPIISSLTGLIGMFKNKGGSQPDAPVGSETAAAASAAATPQSSAMPSADPGAAGASAGPSAPSGSAGTPGVQISISINGVQQV